MVQDPTIDSTTTIDVEEEAEEEEEIPLNSYYERVSLHAHSSEEDIFAFKRKQ